MNHLLRRHDGRYEEASDRAVALNSKYRDVAQWIRLRLTSYRSPFRVPSTPSTLLSFKVKFVFAL